MCTLAGTWTAVPDSARGDRDRNLDTRRRTGQCSSRRRMVGIKVATMDRRLASSRFWPEQGSIPVRGVPTLISKGPRDVCRSL